MTTRRLAATAAAAALLLLASLTACFAPPVLPGGGTPGGGTQGDGGAAAADLAGTTWDGTDSDGDSWVFEFQNDGTVAVTFNGNRFDDATDTWRLSGTTLDIHTVFIDSDYDFTGTYDGGSTIDLDGTYSLGTFGLTIDRM